MTYMIMSRDQNTWQNSHVKIGNEPLKGWHSLNVWQQP